MLVLRSVLPPDMSEVVLDVTATLLSLKVPGFCDVLESFPAAVAFDSAAAKFNKKAHMLTVTMPLMDATT